MITLDVADLVVIAGRTLRLDTGEVLDLLDPAGAERALALVRPGGGPGDPAGLAAMLLRALVRERPLRHGNQQVALAATLQFLALNGWDVDPDPPGAIAAVVAELAAGLLEVRQVADWLAARLRPSGRPGASPEEERVRRASALLLSARLKRVTLREQPTGRFRRFTDQARRAVQLAQEEALLLGHDYVGTEHLLLGLLGEEQEVAATTLKSAGISREDVRGRVAGITRRGPDSPAGHIAFTARAKKVLELSLREALALGHLYIGTEHLLLALLREGQGVAARVLAELGADPAQLRERVLGLLAVDLDAASARRDRDRQLLAGELPLERPLTAGPGDQAVMAENRELRRELQRLRDLLRQHGIEPDDGSARTA